MLVLDARVGDTIFIGGNVAVTVLREVGSGRFKLGFTAPKDVVILREKVKERMEKQNDKR